MTASAGLARVSVLITTYNSAKFLKACLDSVERQTHSCVEVVVVDNASTDGTRDILAQAGQRARIILNEKNTGFAAAQNAAMHVASGDWLLCLNPDIVLGPDFIAEMLRAGELDSKIGTVTGKLLRWYPGAQPEFSEIIDSTGIYFSPSLRHLDRGAEEIDKGQYEKVEYVFGATGAAALYRWEMVQDVSVAGEFFDEQFFAYREDADVAWRAQLMGWKCLYTPKAVAWHERRVTPDRRKQLPVEINWHSVKNRFLMRVKNISWPLYLRFLFQITYRDAQVIGYCLLIDRRLASALAQVWKARRELARKRQLIQGRRRVTDSELLSWFADKPVSVTYR